jgi:RHS repeat-associated protein
LSFDGAGTQTHRYFYGTGVDQVFVDENAQGRVLWTLTDNQGTVRDLIDSAGAIQNHITYDSFGKITSQTNSSITTIFGYTGREYDGETEQYYYRARYYDQNIGRFVSEDPIGFAAGDPNIYRYVGNSPTNFVDPLGLECECSSATSNIDYGTVAAEGAKSAAIGLATVAGVGLAVGAGVISAPAVAVIGGALLLYSAGSSLFRRSEQARASGNNNLGEIAGATALDTFGFGGLVEGIRGRELVTGRCLNDNERSRGIGQGIGNAVTLAGGAKVFNTVSGFAYKATTTTVYRVEGSGNARVLVDGSGNINIQGDQTLFLNFGQKARAEQFLQKRLDQGFSDTNTKTFDVRNRFVNELRQQAVLESEVRQFPTMPIRVDVTKAPDQFGLRANQFESLNNAIIPGSGRIRQ